MDVASPPPPPPPPPQVDASGRGEGGLFGGGEASRGGGWNRPRETFFKSGF